MVSRNVVLVGVLALLALVSLGFLGFVTGFGSLGVAEGFVLLVVLLALANFAVIIAAVVSILTRDDLTGIQRLVWVLISVFVTPVLSLGAIVYFALGRERTRTLFRDLGQPARPPTPPGGQA